LGGKWAGRLQLRWRGVFESTALVVTRRDSSDALHPAPSHEQIVLTVQFSRYESVEDVASLATAANGEVDAFGGLRMRAIRGASLGNRGNDVFDGDQKIVDEGWLEARFNEDASIGFGGLSDPASVSEEFVNSRVAAKHLEGCELDDAVLLHAGDTHDGREVVANECGAFGVLRLGERLRHQGRAGLGLDVVGELGECEAESVVGAGSESVWDMVAIRREKNVDGVEGDEGAILFLIHDLSR
jgi:hypothetical protein